MDTKTISMGGAAWLASSISSFPTKQEFINSELPGSAFRDKNEDVRISLFGQIYDLAVPQFKTELKKKR